MSPDDDLVAWRDSIAGLDVERWWRPIICTHRTGEAAQSEMLGLVFEHVESGETYWAPRSRGLNASRTLTEAPLLQMTRLDEEERVAVRSGLNTQGGSQVWFGRGSLNARCPRGCEVRISRENWDAILENTRRLSPPWLDVSRYPDGSHIR